MNAYRPLFGFREYRRLRCENWFDTGTVRNRGCSLLERSLLPETCFQQLASNSLPDTPCARRIGVLTNWDDGTAHEIPETRLDNIIILPSCATILKACATGHGSPERAEKTLHDRKLPEAGLLE